MYSAMTRVTTDGPSTAIRRSRIPRPGDETGFGLIEGIVAAVILAVLALGLLAGIDGAAGSAGREKIRAVAASLAEQDQERMRTMRAVDLPEHARSWTTNVGGVDYTVVSAVDWVSDTSAAQVSCTSTGGKADLLRLRTTVTSARTGTNTAAVRISSLLAPPIGSAGGANGTLAVALENRDGAAVIGLPVTITATDGSYTATKVTNALGCALFTYIPADTYDVAVNVSPYVDPDGTQAVVAADVTVAAGELSTKELQYDRKATLTASFDTTHWDPVTSTWKTRASRGREVTVTNGGLAATQRVFTVQRLGPGGAADRRDEPVPVQRRLRRVLRRLPGAEAERVRRHVGGDERLEEARRGPDRDHDDPPAGAARAGGERDQRRDGDLQERPQVGRRRQRAGQAGGPPGHLDLLRRARHGPGHHDRTRPTASSRTPPGSRPTPARSRPRTTGTGCSAS